MESKYSIAQFRSMIAGKAAPTANPKKYKGMRRRSISLFLQHKGMALGPNRTPIPKRPSKRRMKSFLRTLEEN